MLLLSMNNARNWIFVYSYALFTLLNWRRNTAGFIDHPSLNNMQVEMAREILQTDFSYVISAPTGSGKTVIFELAICKFLHDIESATKASKLVSLYLAPLKSLCSERMTKWHGKLKSLGFTCLELTSDSPHYEIEDLIKYTVIIATPEKVDSLLRFQEGAKNLLARVGLLMVDEIHTIADQPRGACLETVVLRLIEPKPRIVAATATCPNIHDIAQWLSISERPCLCRSFGSRFRPVPITKVVLGYRKSPQSSLFQFDQFLTKKLLPIIRTYSQGRPTLIFSITRKTVENTAEWLARGGISCPNIRKELLNSISSSLLKECLSRGVGFHHAGVSPADRRLVEEAYLDGCIPVLVSTSTLSLGINLPAHLVIIKNTTLYVEGSTQEYTTRQMLQMIGRAGRPQFSTSATAVIMTTSVKKEYYENWLEDAESVESSLHNCLTDYLNVEVALDRIKSLEDVMQWTSSTYLAIRLPKNPLFYGLQRSQQNATMVLKRLCLDALEKLKSARALKVSIEDQTILPCLTGKLMCEHFLSASTVESFLCLTGFETLIDLIHFVAGCTEMHEISIRNQEKNQLNLINRATGIQRLRYPTKGRITTPQMKAVTLLQAELNGFVVLEESLQQESNKALKIFTRCAAGLRNLLWTTTSSGNWEVATPAADASPPPATMGFACMTHVIELAKVVNYRVWADAPLASLHQLDLDKDYVNQLAGAGVVSLNDIEKVGPRTLERILNRKPPFGDRIYEGALGVPKYELAAEQVTTAAPECVEFEFTIRLIRPCKFDQVALIIGDDKNRVIFKTVIPTTLIDSSGMWSHRIVVHRASEVQLLFTSLISFNFLGIDLNINFPIPWPESCAKGTDQGLTTNLINANQTLPVTVSPYIPISPASVTLRKDCKQKTSKQIKSSTPLLLTPKRACDGLKQANIFAFFGTIKSHPGQEPEGKSANHSTEISPIPKTTNPPSTPALSIPVISPLRAQMPSETPFASHPPSLLPSTLIQTPSEIGPKKFKWHQEASDCISPETDKIVEEELCSFLESVEATEEERSGFIHYRHLDYTISPIFPVDLDKSVNYTTLLKSTERLEPKTSDATSVESPNKTAKNVRPLQSPMGIKTPKEMQLLTSFDDVCESTSRVYPPIFKVPTSITPSRPPQKTQSSLLTRTPSATKLTKKVSFSSLLMPKSEGVSCDTGYVSLPQHSTSKKSQNSVNLMDTTSVKVSSKVAEPVFVARGPDKERHSKRQEMEMLPQARPSRMLDFQLLREGWDQLATFIYCYSILEKLDSVDAEFVAISAPRTPPHNTTDFNYATADLHPAPIDIVSNAFIANANSECKCLHPQKSISEIGDQGTDCQHQLEE